MSQTPCPAASASSPAARTARTRPVRPVASRSRRQGQAPRPRLAGGPGTADQQKVGHVDGRAQDAVRASSVIASCDMAGESGLDEDAIVGPRVGGPQQREQALQLCVLRAAGSSTGSGRGACRLGHRAVPAFCLPQPPASTRGISSSISWLRCRLRGPRWQLRDRRAATSDASSSRRSTPTPPFIAQAAPHPARSAGTPIVTTTRS